MRRTILLILVTILTLGGASAAAQTGDDAASAEQAAATAEELFDLAAAGNFNALYDRIHPDAHAVIPRVVAVRSFEEIYAATEPGRAEITGVEIGAWTWPVTDETYDTAAQVTFTQPYVDAEGQESLLESEMYLVPHDGEWRWFFGNSRVFVAEAMGRFAPPPPAETPGDTDALLNTITRDLDSFYRDSLAASEYDYSSPGVVAVAEGEYAETGCGLAQPGFWAFYCPLDQTVYLDQPFLRDLDQRYGDFAAAFVVGHEWAHHVQTQIGLERSDAPDDIDEVYSIELELGADCLTGVWALDADTRGLLDIADLAEAIAFTFERLGDPEGLSPYDPRAHGTNEQRLGFFVDGYEDGFLGCEAVL